MRRVPAGALFGAIALSIAGCGSDPPQSAANTVAPPVAVEPGSPPVSSPSGSSSPGPLSTGPAAPTATLRVGFGGIADTIAVSAIESQPLRAAALVAPDGTLIPASDITVSDNPRIRTGQWSLTHPWDVSLDPANTFAAMALPNGQAGAALYSDQQLLATVSRADLPLPDPVAYRRDWRDWRIRLTFGTLPGELQTLVIAAPEPPPQ